MPVYMCQASRVCRETRPMTDVLRDGTRLTTKYVEDKSMSSAPDTPSTPPHKLPAKRGEAWNKKPSHSTISRAISPPTTRGSRSFISCLHRHVARGLGLAGLNDALLLVAGLQAFLDGH